MDCNIGDWFILTQISKNVDPFFYEKFMDELSTIWSKQQNSLETEGLVMNEIA